MGNATDIEELLPLAKHQIAMRKLYSAVKLVFAFASAFGGAAWSAHQYLAQLATKDDVALLIKGQQEQIRELQSSVALLSDRQTRTEVRVDDLRGTMRIRP